MGLIVADERFVQEAIALLVAVTVEGFLLCLILDRRVQRVDDGRHERTGDVADAQTDDVRFRVSGGIFVYLACDRGKQIALLQIVIVLIDLHVLCSFSAMLRQTP